MKSGSTHWLKRMSALLTAPPSEPAERAQRILALQRNIILPARVGVIAAVFYYLYWSPWLSEVVTTYGVVFETIQTAFAAYALLILVATVLLFVVRRFPPGIVQWVVFIMGLGDGVFLGGLTVLTGGYESILYWVYPGVIILNAISIPLATPQIVLNLVLSIFFLLAGLIETSAHLELSLSSFSLHGSKVSGSSKISVKDIKDLSAMAAWLKQAPEPLARFIWETLPEPTRKKLSAPIESPEQEVELKSELAESWNRIFFPAPRYVVTTNSNTEPAEPLADPYVLRVAVLLLLTFCCYGVQVLVAGQERAGEEQEEFSVRTGQLRAAGRLAAEFAHQIKNPLAIINNVTFSLQKSLHGDKPEITKQIAIIQEEVARADQIITQIMGYAQLSEGRVEKLNVLEEIDRAVHQIFPPGVQTDVKLHRNFAVNFPPLLMQRRHFSEALGNLLQNAREAVSGSGNIFLNARTLGDYSVEIVIRDDGGGISPDKMGRIFEAYYTTKEGGTGLGLAIVKHNAELYGGSVRVESELGKGAKFTLLFPARTLAKPGK